MGGERQKHAKLKPHRKRTPLWLTVLIGVLIGVVVLVIVVIVIIETYPEPTAEEIYKLFQIIPPTRLAAL